LLVLENISQLRDYIDVQFSALFSQDTTLSMTV